MNDSIRNLFENLDPDSNYFDDLFPSLELGTQSNYFTLSEFSSLCTQSPNSKTILSYNIRSFNRNSDTFLASFDQISLPSVLILTETWFKPGTAQNIPGYTAYHTFRVDGRSGGVSVFVNDSISSYCIEELCISNSNIEICSVEVGIGGASWCLLGIYRPHSGTTENFMNQLNQIFHHNKLRNKKCIVIGDINIDLLKTNSAVDEFLAGMRSCHYVPIISKPTRFPPDESSPPSLMTTSG